MGDDDNDGEQSYLEQAEELWDEAFGDDPPAEEGPISVPYEEPSEEEKERLRHQSALSDLITQVCNNLEAEVGAVQTVAGYTNSSSTRDEMRALAGQCTALSGKAYAAAAQLTNAGIGSDVYSVQACNEVGFWANSAAGHATNAAASEYDSEITSYLDSVVNELANAAHKIRGA